MRVWNTAAGVVRLGAPEPQAEAVDSFAQMQQAFDAQQFALARSIGQTLLASDPAHVATLHLLSKIMRRSGDYAGALGYLKQALELAPRDFRLYVDCGLLFGELGKVQRSAVGV